MSFTNYNFLWDCICKKINKYPGASFYSTILSSFEILNIKGNAVNIFTNYQNINTIIDSNTRNNLEQIIRIVLNNKLLAINYQPLYINTLFIDNNKTLDNFSLNSENRLAIAVANDICSISPNNIYTPLYLYADTGLGKTHLINAIVLEYSKKFTSKKINHYTGDSFINSFFEATKKNSLQKWREYNEECDLFIIDDIHLLENNSNAIEEFSSLFDTLYSNNKKPHLIITSNTNSSNLNGFTESLKSKLQWGVKIEILSPNKSTKENIINSICNKNKITIKPDVKKYIAKNYNGNIRGLEGLIKTVYTHSTLLNEEITTTLIDKALGKENTSRQYSINGSDIIYNVCKYFNISEMEIKAKNRTRSIAFPRQIGMYITKSLTNTSLQEIGKLYGGRDHSTVKHSNDKIKKLYKNDSNVKKTVDNIIKLINHEKTAY